MRGSVLIGMVVAYAKNVSCAASQGGLLIEDGVLLPSASSESSVLLAVAVDIVELSECSESYHDGRSPACSKILL